MTLLHEPKGPAAPDTPFLWEKGAPRVGAFIAVTVIASLGLTALPAHAAVQVKIEDFLFTPSTLTVAEGTAITWHHVNTVPTGTTHHTSNGARSGRSPARRIAISQGSG